LLSSPIANLQQALPSGSASNLLKDSESARQLRSLMQQVDAIKNEREVMENELKSATSDMSKS